MHWCNEFSLSSLLQIPLEPVSLFTMNFIVLLPFIPKGLSRLIRTQQPWSVVENAAVNQGDDRVSKLVHG